MKKIMAFFKALLKTKI